MTIRPGTPVLTVVGPTAAGKSDLAVALAAELGGEIIAADSRTVYRGMDIGTAKATPEQRARVPHHLLDIIEPGQVLTLAEYQRLAWACIADIDARGRLPMLVGGTGQYVRAVMEGWTVPEVAPDLELRGELETLARREGSPALHERLAVMDPVAASRIDHRNVRRVIRALEVCLKTGRPISELQARRAPPFRAFWLGVTRPREQLYVRIDARVDRMLADGLESEVRRLLELGYGPKLPALTGLGYRQVGLYVRGEISLEQAVRLIKQATRRFVHQQFTWFRLDDPAIHWVDPGEMPFEAIVQKPRAFFNAGKGLPREPG